MDEISSKIAIISFSPIHRDARVLRQAEYLSGRFTVTMIGYGQLDSPLDPGVQTFPIQARGRWMRRARKLLFLPLGRILPRWAYESCYWGQADHRAALSALLRSDACVVHANDWEALPVAGRASEETGACVVLDLHEYASLQSENRWYWRTFYHPMIDYVLRKYTSRISASVTVNEAISERYAREYGFRPIVVMNAPKCTEAPGFKPTQSGRIRLVHHGVAKRDRRLELMIQTIAHADSRYALHFMLIERSRGYVSQLKALAQRVASGRVSFHQPVRPAEIVDRISEFDMGIYLLPPANFNQSAALPNKFFDFVAAGLAICIGPSLEMARLTQRFGFGVVAPSFEPIEVAKLLNSLNAADINQMKLRALEARKVLNADVEMGKLVDLYAELVGGAQERDASLARRRSTLKLRWHQMIDVT